MCNAVFPRSDIGSVSIIELHLLFYLLNGKSALLRHHMPAYWERISKGTTGAICCESQITRLCILFDVKINEPDAIPRDLYLTFDVLHNMDVVKVDQNNRAYVYQLHRGDHFPLPCPSLTHVDGWEDKSNWRMDTPAHLRVIASHPFFHPWKMHVTLVSSIVLDPGAVAESSCVHEENLKKMSNSHNQLGPSIAIINKTSYG